MKVKLHLPHSENLLQKLKDIKTVWSQHKDRHIDQGVELRVKNKSSHLQSVDFQR